MDRRTLTETAAVDDRGRAAGALVLTLVLVAAVVLVFPVPAGDIGALAGEFWLSWALCVALLSRRGWYRPSTTYLVLFGLFHGGLLVTVAVRGPAAFTAYDTSWLYEAYTPVAVRLAIVGMIAFTLCAHTRVAAARPAPRPAQYGPVCGTIGLGVELLGIAIFGVAAVKAGGVEGFLGGYTTFLRINESDGLLGYGTLCIGFGAVLAIVAGGWARTAAWVGFGGYAVVAFLIGTRGAVLFPLVAMLVVEARRGRAIRPLWTILGIPCLLAVIGLIRTARLGGGASSSLLAAPLDAIAEMGHSLRPTVVVLDWHAYGEPYRFGETLVVLPVRVLETLTGWHGGPPTVDTRMFNVEIFTRVGPIGGSPVAEGYHNLGFFGVVLGLGLIGLVLSRLERLPSTPLGDATVGVVLLPLLTGVRNSFAPIPVQVALGILLVILARAAIWLGERRRTREVAP
ncbi:O-antigen polysaccharide polymerase Wzy [Actinophytocola sp.]|uniref:O-antigen polysaccharide polymerase Wzy n=1 Tax=Actinophytocola sp. TaxID=1872138 RepID=UPI002ED4D38F